MKDLHRRLETLEARKGNDLAHLSDEQLEARLIAVGERIEGFGELLPSGWREKISGPDLSFLDAWINDRKARL